MDSTKSTGTGGSLKLVDVTRLFTNILPVFILSVLAGLYLGQINDFQLKLKVLTEANGQLTSSVSALSGDVQRLILISDQVSFKASAGANPLQEAALVSTWGSVIAPSCCFILTVGLIVCLCYFGGKGLPPDSGDLPDSLLEVCDEVLQTAVPYTIKKTSWEYFFNRNVEDSSYMLFSRSEDAVNELIAVFNKYVFANMHTTHGNSHVIVDAIRALEKTQLELKWELECLDLLDVPPIPEVVGPVRAAFSQCLCAACRYDDGYACLITGLYPY